MSLGAIGLCAAALLRPEALVGAISRPQPSAAARSVDTGALLVKQVVAAVLSGRPSTRLHRVLISRDAAYGKVTISYADPDAVGREARYVAIAAAVLPMLWNREPAMGRVDITVTAAPLDWVIETQYYRLSIGNTPLVARFVSREHLSRSSSWSPPSPASRIHPSL